MIDVDELLPLILAGIAPLPASRDDLLACVGRVLAEDLLAVDPVPPFANSAMDGFAIRRADLDAGGEHGTRFRVVDELPAGLVADRPIGPGETASIATGGMIPPGADAVVPIEQATGVGEMVSLRGPVPEHGHVRPAGEDVPVGGVLATVGAIVTARLASLAMAAGVRSAAVIARPRVGVLTTGDELIPMDAPLAHGSIRDINGYLLRSAIEAHGMTAVDLGHCADDARLIGDRLSDAHDIDAIVVSGGLGKGAKDVIVDAIARIGTIRAFEVEMRPGKPFALGAVEGAPLFALPGNPVAAVVALHVLVIPALRRLGGRSAGREWSAVLTRAVENRGGRRHLIRVGLACDGGVLRATPADQHGSGVLSSLAAADALLEIPGAVQTARSGEIFQVIPLAPMEGF